MEQTPESEIEVKRKIQDELVSINAILIKIKEELFEINGIVQSNGSLDTNLKNAIDSLVVLAEEAGVTVNEEVATENETPLTNVLSRISTEYVTQKLKSLTHQ